MADETLRFDIVGDDHLSEPLGRAGASAEGLSRHMDAAARSAAVLDEALRRQNTASRVSVDASLALARADKILEDAEHGLRDGALEAEFALKKEADAAKQSGRAADEAAAKNRGLQASLQKVADSAKGGGGPGWLGPALLALPALGTLTGVVAVAAAGLAGAFTAGAGAVAAFGAVAKPVLTDALKAEQAVQKAQDNYTVAVTHGTPVAKAYAAEQKAIAKAYVEMSPAQIALSKQLGAMADAWDKVKAAQTPVVAGALQPWLKSVTDLTSKLAPIIAKVSPVIKDLGVQFGLLVNSAAFTRFRDFIANTGSGAVGAFGKTFIDFLKAGAILLVQFNPLIEKAVGWIGGLGPAVLKWASSKKTADDITKFMAWFTANGPVVGDLLKNIGKALATLAPGLTAGGAFELKVISDFFGWVAKLPKGIAAPLAEVAGALLILNKLGVFSVGVKFVGLAAGWITKLLGGATVEVGAAGMQKAGGTMVTAAGLMQRAADTMVGGAGAGGAAGKAGGAAGAGGAGAAASGAAALGTAAAGAIIGALIRGLGDALSPQGSVAGKLNKMLQNLGTPISTSLLHAFTFGGLEAKLTAEIGMPVGKVENSILAGAKIWGGNLASSISGSWSNIFNGAKLWWKNISSAVTGSWANLLGGAKAWGSNLASSISGTWNNIRGAAVTAWNTIWSNVTSAVSRGVAAVVGFFTVLPGKITAVLGSAGKVLAGWGAGVISGLLQGMQSVITQVWDFIKSIPGKILSFLGHASPPKWAIQAGKDIMNGLGIGMAQAQAVFTKASVAAAKAAASAATGALGTGGVSNASGVAALKSAAAKHGWTSAAEWNALNAVEMREAGYNLTAKNPSSGAYGMAQFINGPSEYAQYGGNSTTYAGQATAMANYIAQRYGDPIAAWAHEQAYGWYDRGGWLPAGLSLALNTSGRAEKVLSGGELDAHQKHVLHEEHLHHLHEEHMAELRALRAELRQLTSVAGFIPQKTGQHVAAGINGAAAQGSFRARYP